MPRASSLALSLIGLLVCGVLGAIAESALTAVKHQARLDANRELVARLGLTDLALFTEARYTRHPSQADLHSAQQDHPGAFDHFPSGSLLAPPAHLTRLHVDTHEPVAGKTTSPD